MQPDVSLDTSFYHSGTAITYEGIGYNICHSMQLQTDGKIILGGLGGFSATGADFTLMRCNIDGSLDRSYGDTGVVNIDFNGNDDEIWAMCLMVN